MLSLKAPENMNEFCHRISKNITHRNGTPMEYGNDTKPLFLVQYIVIIKETIAREYVNGKRVSWLRGEKADLITKFSIPVSIFTTRKNVTAKNRNTEYNGENLVTDTFA
jgi:hypothetical protein